MYDVPNYKERKNGGHAPGDPAHVEVANEAQPQGTDPASLPGIHLYWSEAAQDVALQFDTKQFRQWQFLIAVLDMAKRKAEKMLKMAEIAEMQRAQAEMAQAQKVVGHVLRGRH